MNDQVLSIEKIFLNKKYRIFYCKHETIKNAYDISLYYKDVELYNIIYNKELDKYTYKCQLYSIRPKQRSVEELLLLKEIIDCYILLKDDKLLNKLEKLIKNDIKQKELKQ